jgi:uncharacterized protein (TIGR03437 family)
VDVNGLPAMLLYVSPRQINFVTPSGLTPGNTTLTIRSNDTTVTRNANVTVAAAAPALFSSDASGSGTGAILNAVTFSAAPFLVDTAENGGDNRTRLALYGTGLRHASTVSARAGNAVLAVEYFGPAPGFFGLDQVNVVLPASLDGVGDVSLTVQAADLTSNSVTARIDLLPVARLQLRSVSLTPAFVNGGDSFSAAVALNGVARSGGFTLSLRSTNLNALAPAVLTIPQGQFSADAVVRTTSVNSVQTGSIVATAGAVTRSADFEIDPANTARLATVSLSAGSLLGGKGLTGTVTLTDRAPANGVTVQLSSDLNSVHPPGTVVVPFNQSSANFSIATDAVNAVADATITATLGRDSVTASLRLLPPLSLTLDATSVTGGNSVTGTITLGESAPAGGALIQVSSGDNSIARTPNPVTIQQGNNSNSFTITTFAVTSARTTTITVSYQGLSRSVSLTVNPPAAVTLTGLSVSPSTVAGGTSAQGSVTLSGAAGFGGQRVDVTSSSPITANVPSFVTVPQGATNAQFTILTTSQISAQTVTITATMNGVTRTTVLTVR